MCDEEWRTAPFAHAERFAGWDACLCFEAGELHARRRRGRRRAAQGRGHDPGARRKGRAAHSGSAPDRGRNALLALAAAAQSVAACHAPDGPDRLTAVPTVLNAGDAFNVVPGRGELFCDLRADNDAAIIGVLDGDPRRASAASRSTPELHAAVAGDGRRGGDGAAARARDGRARPPRRRRAPRRRERREPPRAAIPLTVDGLGPRGGKAHNPGEFVLADVARDAGPRSRSRSIDAALAG